MICKGELSITLKIPSKYANQDKIRHIEFFKSSQTVVSKGAQTTFKINRITIAFPQGGAKRFLHQNNSLSEL